MSETVIVEGVLESAAGGLHGRQGLHLVFDLMPWLRVDGACHAHALARPLRVEIEVDASQLDREMKRLEKGTIVELSVDLLDEESAYHTVASGSLPVSEVRGSQALLAARAARERSVIIRDAVLGRLVLKREYSWFETRLTFRGRRCQLAICQTGTSDDPARDLRDVERARTLVARIDAAYARYRAAIGRRMLPLYNDNWRNDRRELTRDAFLARIRPTAIVVQPDGSATLSFSDGGLFYDHTIDVQVGPRGGITRIGLSG